MSIEDAVARAAAVNFDVGSSRKDIEVAQASLERSQAWLPANPYFAAGAQRTSSSGVGPNYALQLSQEFEIAGQRATRIRSATHAVEKATADLETAQQNLIAAVKAAYIDALVGLQRVTLGQQALAAAQRVAAPMATSSATSEIQRIDRNLAQIQESRGRREVAAAEHARDSAFATLRRLAGIAYDQPLELTGTLRTEIVELPPTPALVEGALQRRTDLAALRHYAEHAGLQVELAKKTRLPNVTLSGTVSRFEGDTLTGGDVGFALPLFDRKQADIHENTAERDRLTLQKQYLERTIAQEVVEARGTCTAAAVDLDALNREIVPKSEENFALEGRLYDRHVVSIADLIGVHVDLLLARREQLDAVQAYNQALVELERVIAGSLNLGAGHPAVP